MGRKNKQNNIEFLNTAVLNNQTYIDFTERFKKVALSLFEWVNLPQSMNARYIEQCLYYEGKCAFLKDKNYGFINTKCSYSENLNIYGEPTSLNCYSYSYTEERKLYSGLELPNENEFTESILVRNNSDMIATAPTLELFAYRLYEIQRAIDTNVNAQKFPILILADEKQKQTMINLYQKYNGNYPFIFGDKNLLNNDTLKAINTDAPYVADKLSEYKKEIFNEALTFLGINNIMIEKKERLINEEANSNNEFINLNLQSYLVPRQKACEQFNEKYKLPENKKISVRLRSDLKNILKSMESIVQDYNLEGVDLNEQLHDGTSKSM